jgi:aryl-alcohol dehydrogenase-like predicted oxidoreductase
MDDRTPIEEMLDVVKASKARCIGASSIFTWEYGKVLHFCSASTT